MKLFSISDKVQYEGKPYTVSNITQHGVSLEVIGKGTKKSSLTPLLLVALGRSALAVRVLPPNILVMNLKSAIKKTSPSKTSMSVSLQSPPPAPLPRRTSSTVAS